MDVYWTGISQPAKGTRRAPSAAWRSYRGVRRSVCTTADPIRNQETPVTVEESGMSPSEQRAGEIESMFRNVNEQIAAAADRFEIESAEFYCECHDPACSERVIVPLEDYERVRSKPTRFLHVEGHVEDEFESVVATRRRYAIVEKFGATLTRIVRRLDPRTQPV
jgi:hypothetical protein